MKKDDLITCPCSRKSDAMYEISQGPDMKTKICYGCGFNTNSLMKEGETFLEEQLESLPELYKDLMWEDEEGNKWIPATLNLPQQGMVFINGTSTDNWGWAAVKAVEIPEEDRERFPIPGKEGEFYKHRMDMETMQMFDKYDFIEAMDYAGAFEELVEK